MLLVGPTAQGWKGCSLPEKLTSRLDAEFQEWSFAPAQAHWESYFEGREFGPSCIPGDFDGNTEEGYVLAVTFKRAGSRQHVLAVFMSNGGDYAQHVLAGPHEAAPLQQQETAGSVLWFEPKGTVVREVLEGERFSREVKLENDAFTVWIGEVAAITYVFRQGGFFEIVTSD